MKLIHLLSLSTVSANNDPTFKSTGHIVGGLEVSPKFKYPWMVSLLYYNENFCGGTLIGPKLVVSAGHCVFGVLNKWEASLHRHFIQQRPEVDDGHNYKITERITHPKYVPKTFSYDAAVWKLAEPIKTFNIKLDNKNLSNESKLVYKVIGWGSIAANGDDSPVLMEVQVPNFNITQCQLIYPTLDTGSQFCAGYPEGGKDSCQGDSGGPIFYESSNHTTLVGIVSWGKGCAAPNFPGVYTRISQVKDFIESYL